MKNLVILIIGLLICTTAFGQTDHLTLYKLPEKNKTKRIKLNKPIKFEIGLQKTASFSFKIVICTYNTTINKQNDSHKYNRESKNRIPVFHSYSSYWFLQ